MVKNTSSRFFRSCHSPQEISREFGSSNWRQGKRLFDTAHKRMTIEPSVEISSELVDWTKKFIHKYKDALETLARSNMKYLTAQEVLIVHALLIDEIGGSHGIETSDCFKPRFINHRQCLQEKNFIKMFSKGGGASGSFGKLSRLLGGNKQQPNSRGSFLHENKYELTASNKEVAFVVLEVATKEINIKKLEIWIKKNCRKI